MRLIRSDTSFVQYCTPSRCNNASFFKRYVIGLQLKYACYSRLQGFRYRYIQCHFINDMYIVYMLQGPPYTASDDHSAQQMVSGRLEISPALRDRYGLRER